MISANKSWMSRGVYTPDQASGILGLRADLVRRWIYGRGDSEAALIPEYPCHAGELITFLDLVQAMAIRDIRDQRRLSLQKIRKTVEAARRNGIEFPFATRHKTYIFSDDVVLRLNDGRLIQVTGKYKSQDLMEPIVYSYLDDIGYDDHGLAKSYTACRLGIRTVELNPLINYGAPTVCPGLYTVSTLVNAFYAEGSIDSAANICDVNRDAINLALKYEKQLQTAA